MTKQLALLGYSPAELSAEVLLNLDFARANMKSAIYDQAILEGVSTTYPQTESIIENGTVNGMTAGDIQKVLNLKHAWEFVLDEDILMAESDYYLLSYIAKLVNEGFYYDGGGIRRVPATIGGCDYAPPIPDETTVKEKIRSIIASGDEKIDVAVSLCLYCMRTQVFIDGNKRAAVIFANHYLIANGQGLLVIPEKDVPEFKKLLIEFYEGDDAGKVTAFLKKKCWRRMTL